VFHKYNVKVYGRITTSLDIHIQYSAVLGLVISSGLEFIDVWLTVWFRCAKCGSTRWKASLQNACVPYVAEKKTFFLLSKRVADHARHRFCAFELCDICQKFKIFQTIRSHFKILGAGKILQGSFHFEDAQILGATVRSPGICAPLNIPLYFRFEVEGYRNMNKRKCLCCPILHSYNWKLRRRMRDLRLQPRCKRDLHCVGILRSVEW